ncbi:hypothetical protein, partial [Azospirillum rugosum]
LPYRPFTFLRSSCSVSSALCMIDQGWRLDVGPGLRLHVDPLPRKGDGRTVWVWAIWARRTEESDWEVVDGLAVDRACVVAELAMNDAVAALLALGVVTAHDLARLARGERLR